MTWQQFRERQHAIEAVLRYCREHPAETLTPDAAPAAWRIFADRDELLAALQHKWTQALIGRLDLAVTGVEDRADRVEAVTAAWYRTATANATLRHVLDRNAESAGPRFAAAYRRESHLLALASGLTRLDTPEDAAENAGAALRARLALPSRRTEPDVLGSVDAEA